MQQLTFVLTGGPYTTKSVDDISTESNYLATEHTTVATTSPASTPTAKQTILSSSTQSSTPIIQTVISTIKQTIATTVVRTVFPSASQAGGPGIPHATLNEPDLVCIITPTITTTVLIQGSICPNSAPGNTQVQTQILSLHPILPVPIPIPFPVPVPAPAPAYASVPTQPAPISVSTLTPLPLPTPSVAHPVFTWTTTATTTATTTREITDTKCPNDALSRFPATSQPPGPSSETYELDCPCEAMSSTPYHTPRKRAVVLTSQIHVFIDTLLQCRLRLQLYQFHRQFPSLLLHRLQDHP